ncbi:LOW QUALITY PROTEIN: olfactory receptor 1I1 [Ctenodactylus gundi]
MKLRNQTLVSEFLLLGLSEDPALQPILFGLFLSMHLVSVTGNLLVVLATITDPRLHTPAYFFLSSLSLVDILFSPTTVPKMLVSIHTQSRAIPFAGCLAQMPAFHLFGTIDSFLLAVTAIARLLAIAHPLLLSPCGLLVGGPRGVTSLQSLVHTCLLAQLTFCDGSEIPHFFYNLMPLLKLSCSDTHTHELAILAFGAIMGISRLSCALLSYICISWAVLRIPSAQGKWKAFSTCGSRVTVVLLFYGTIFAVCLQPASPASSQKDKAAALMCGDLNPFIYSLRNKDMKAALKKLFGKAASSQA